MTKDDVELFITRLDKVMTKVKSEKSLNPSLNADEDQTSAETKLSELELSVSDSTNFVLTASNVACGDSSKTVIIDKDQDENLHKMTKDSLHSSTLIEHSKQ